MPAAEIIKTVMERNIKAVKLKPSIGIVKETMRTEMTAEGLCQIADGDTTLTIDISKDYGGGNTTPSPGFYARAALSACLAQGYLIWAACMGVEIGRINIDISSEYDARGGFGIDPDIRAGITRLHYVVNIESSADPEKVQQVIDQSDAIDYVRDIFAGELTMTRELRVVPMPNEGK